MRVRAVDGGARHDVVVTVLVEIDDASPGRREVWDFCSAKRTVTVVQQQSERLRGTARHQIQYVVAIEVPDLEARRAELVHLRTGNEVAVALPQKRMHPPSVRVPEHEIERTVGVRIEQGSVRRQFC